VRERGDLLEEEGEPSPSTQKRQRARRPKTRDTGAVSKKRPRTLPSKGTEGPESSGASSTGVIRDHSLIGATVGGRYEVTGVIAEGGMGCVYHATHRILDRDYALKVIHPELASNGRLVERFLREARAAARIKSDHVVQILDFGALDDGTSYFVMEYLDGVSLEEVLDAGVMPLPEVLSVGIQMARGLAAAHERGIVHRDLKPANVLLLPQGTHSLVKLLDFGIAKIPTSDGGEKLTLVNSIVGTPHYMAPEQIAGAVDARADIYAMGAVLFEMLTRYPPFDDESLALLLAKHRTEPPPHPRDVVGERCPVALEEVILRCLAKDKAERFQSADDLCAALEAVRRDL
jgi:serine/threonine-protein kinase